MRKRNCRIQLWLSEREYAHLKKNADKCGYRISAYLRSIIANRIPKELPPKDYHEVVRLQYLIIGQLNLLNRLSLNEPDHAYLNREIDKLKEQLIHLQYEFTEPAKEVS